MRDAPLETEFRDSVKLPPTRAHLHE